MKQSKFKNALVGIAHAIVAAYVFPAVYFLLWEGVNVFEVLFSGFPLFALSYCFWIVIPLGVALGMLIPQIANGKNRWQAALKGAIWGAFAGLVSVYTFTSVFPLGRETRLLWVSVIPYCAVWVGAYAYYCARRQRQYA